MRFKSEDLEAGKFGRLVDQAAGDYRDKRAKALNEAAARGFPAPPGETLETIIFLGQETKERLTEGNAELYGDLVGKAYAETETDQKVIVGFARLDLEAYRARLKNLVDLQRAEDDHDLSRYRARLEIAKSDIEKRQAAIIEEKARIEHEVNYWRKLAIQAEGIALNAELALVNEKVVTAQARLAIIPELYKLIEAEKVVLEQERRRAVALELVLVAEKELAEIKKTLIPLMKEKAGARLDQAEAIEHEAEIKEALERLGFRRLALKEAQEVAEHRIRQAEQDFEEAKLAYVRADRATELARNRARIEHQEYHNKVQDAVIVRNTALDRLKKRWEVDQKWHWQLHGLNRQFDELRDQAQDFWAEWVKKAAAVVEVTKKELEHIRAHRERTEVLVDASTAHQYISKG